MSGAGFKSALSAAWRDDRGAISIVMVGVLSLLIGLSSLFIDFGSLYFTKDHLQGAVDRAALKAATDPGRATELAQEIVQRNTGTSASTVSVELGRYPPSGFTMATVATLPVSDRFQVTAVDPNALRVVASSQAPLFFSRIFTDSDGRVSASAIALNEPVTQLMAGTQFADPGVADTQVFNSVMSSLIGTTVTLATADYRNLVSGSVDLLSLLDELILITGLAEGAYLDVLNEPVTFLEIIDAATGAIASDPALASVAADLTSTLNTIRGQVSGLDPITLGDFISLDASDPDSGAGARIDLFGLIFGSSEVLNDQESIVSGATLTIGAATATLRASVVQPPQYSAIGGAGTTVRTAQMRMFLEAEIADAFALPVLGGTVDVRLPVYATQGSGTATVTKISCATPDPAEGRVDANAVPGLLTFAIGDVDPSQLSGPPPTVNDASILDVTVAGASISVTASSNSSISGAPRDLTFTDPFTEDNYQVVPLASPTDDVVADSWTSISPGTISITGLPQITADAIELQLGPLISSVLTPLAPLIDDVFGVLQSAFGLESGYMKVADTYLRCSRPMLAQ